MTLLPGRASAGGTTAFAARFPALEAGSFYRSAAGLRLSSLGLGTYLGQPDEATDLRYTEAVEAAVRGGINVLDAAINYRNQRSERSIGAAIAKLTSSGELTREELLICTKAGFLTPGAVDPAMLPQDAIAGNMHAMDPDFLEDQIDRSRANLGIETIDVFYLHNPETQLQFVSRQVFDERLERAFARLERLVEAGKIAVYGAATWDGFRAKKDAPTRLSLHRMLEIAAAEAGDGHHFRFIQLPVNLAMPEAYVQRAEAPATAPLEIASRNGITCVASASLLQARLSRDLSEQIATLLPGYATDAQRAIQFARSTPGVSVALVGMSSAAHVAENLGVAARPPLTLDEYRNLYRRQ